MLPFQRDPLSPFHVEEMNRPTSDDGLRTPPTPEIMLSDMLSGSMCHPLNCCYWIPTDKRGVMTAKVFQRTPRNHSTRENEMKMGMLTIPPSLRCLIQNVQESMIG